jgi:WD40 repeat protein
MAASWSMMSGMTRAERAEVMLRMKFGPNQGVAFSPSGALLATASSDATARVWDAASGACLATLVPLPSGGYLTLLPDGRYKLNGDPGDRLWWASGLRRLGLDEVSGRFPEIRRLPPGAPVLPG